MAFSVYLSKCSIAIKSHHDKDNSYKRKHVSRGLLAVLEG